MVCTAIPSQTIYAQLKQEDNEVSTNRTINLQEKELVILEIRAENQSQTIKTFRLGVTKKNDSLVYQPGDYLTLYLPTEHGATTSRSYTISSSPTQSDQWIEITVKKELNGLASLYLHETVSIEDTLQVRLPLHDDLTLPTDCTTPLVLISGGIGITPMISIARALNARQWKGPIYFIHASQQHDTLPFERDEDYSDPYSQSAYLYLETGGDFWGRPRLIGLERCSGPMEPLSYEIIRFRNSHKIQDRACRVF